MPEAAPLCGFGHWVTSKRHAYVKVFIELDTRRGHGSSLRIAEKISLRLRLVSQDLPNDRLVSAFC